VAKMQLRSRTKDGRKKRVEVEVVRGRKRESYRRKEGFGSQISMGGCGHPGPWMIRTERYLPRFVAEATFTEGRGCYIGAWGRWAETKRDYNA